MANLYFNGPKSEFRMDTTLGETANSLWTLTDDPVTATVGSELSITPKVKKVQFGDGYSQRSMDGINAIPKVFSLEFRKMELRYAKALEAFFEGSREPYDRTPAEFFYFTPYLLGHEEGKYICTNHRLRYDTGVTITVNAVFEEVFDFGEVFDYS